MIQNEFVFGNFPHQIKDTLFQLVQGLSNQDSQIFEDQDLIVTQHSQISSYILKEYGEDLENAPPLNDLFQLHRGYNVVGMIHSKKILDCN